ncbi:cell division protein PerM [Barrientosiimonas endolithica]|uniref:Integral membrane protein n=1 Tax=Barrientosiimonas endolithica TaxID=1535208 RepID=A0ABM8HDP1_9MICO|nr:DUF6350 family protein [Barrientosiimonas endolithica]BDZ59097.1 hypothetical protein GCM10025872_27540 [Barrientosiimonas endolithica]
MTLLERTRQIVPGPSLDPQHRWHRLLVAAGFGAVAAFALALILVVPSVAGWVTDAQSTATWSDALSFAPALWVLVHRGSVTAPGDAVAVTAPLLALTAGAVLLARSAARAALVKVDTDVRPAPSATTSSTASTASTASDDADSEDDARGGDAWWHLPAAFVGGYALSGVLLALLAWVGPTRPNPLYVLPGSIVVAALGMGWALLRSREDPEADAALEVIDGLTERVPVVVRRALQPALVGAGVLLVLGALLALVAVALSWSRVSQIGGELGVGATAGVLLTLGQLLALPNVAAWSAAWLSGASVTVGPVSVGHAAISPGLLPMVPVFGAIPEAGAGPAWAPFVPLVPVAVGAVVGLLTLRRLTSLASLQVKVRTAAVAGALAGGIVLAVGYLGSMGLSEGAMSYVGPHLLAIPLLLLELVVGAVAAATALHYWRTHR